MEINAWIIPVAAFIPMLVGGLWYSPMLFGKAWQKEVGLTDEEIQSGNMVVTMGLAYLFSCFLAFGMMSMCIHQIGVFQLFSEPENQANLNTVLAMVGDKHMTFGHGVLHGILGALTLAMPVLITNGLFAKHSWKLMGINVGYWVVAMGLMGGAISQFGVTITAS